MSVANQSPVDMTVVCIGSRWRIVVRGELDLATGGHLLRVGQVLASARVIGADIDLADVSFIDTAGWRAVEATRQAILDAGGTSCLVAVSATVDRLLRHVDGPDGGLAARRDLVTVG
jgi:anti-anti-sigma factor